MTFNLLSASAVSDTASQAASSEPAHNLSISQSLSVALIGFAFVFGALIMVMIMIKLMSLFGRKKLAVDSTGAASPPAPAAAPALASGSYGTVELNGVEDKTAAMLMAIAADKSGVPLNELRFISIKELPSEQ